MANSTVMLAAAGSGKTYYIANYLDPLKKNLVITFTNQNVKNLEREIIQKYKKIPNNTKVLTFSSFIYRWLLKPFEPILRVGNQECIISSGVEVNIVPEPQSIQGKPNPKYKKKDDLKHYFFQQKYYVSRMPSLFNEQKLTIKKTIVQRLNKFCDCIYFDELQDFMEDDFKLIQFLIKSNDLEVFTVGDFYQHSVSKSNKIGNKPFKKGKSYISKDDYMELFPATTIIDEKTLIKSRRVPKEICEFIKSKLNIHIDSLSNIEGKLKLLSNSEEILSILEDKSIHKLVFKESHKYTFSPCINWGYSKGDTYKKTCIILTSTFNNLFEDSFSIKDLKLSAAQINTLYVAVTRATHAVYFIKESDFRILKKDFQKGLIN